MNYTKYGQYPHVQNFQREWPNKQIEKAPIYCSVDLRDGNQALVKPLSIEQKMQYFDVLVAMGFKQIEVGYPSASQTEFDFIRTLIEQDKIPQDVSIQVLIPARKELIERSVAAMQGVKRGIFHLYNPTSEFQKEHVFAKDDAEIITMAVTSMQYLIDATKEFEGDILYEYTPESFSQTDLEFAVKICNEVIKVVQPSPTQKLIINLPNTLEASLPNVYADRVEWMCKHFIQRQNLVVSVHPHNDRGTSVASAEMAVLAGADRIEGTLFGNGERAGNLDLVNFAFNIYSQGVDPELDLSTIDSVKSFVEQITEIKTHIRHPYVGEMIYTAFSGGHQDAIKKGFDFYNQTDKQKWCVPYLPIDPKDIGRDYSEVVRINSQSGKGGAAFIIGEFFGEQLSKDEAKRFGEILKEVSDKKARELSKTEIIELYKSTKEKNNWNAHKYKKHASFVSDLGADVVKLLAPKEEESILDLGCGDGTLALCIQRYGSHVKAVDLSEDMVAKAKTKGIDASRASVLELPFVEEFDAVFSNAVLHWVKESSKALENIYKVLKHKGRFVAEFGAYSNIAQIENAIKEFFAKHPEFGAFESPWYFPKESEYTKLLESHGFEVLMSETISRPTPVDEIANWLEVFANGITEHLEKHEKEYFIQEITKMLRPSLYTKERGWVLDYVRLRIKAYKP